MKRRQLIFGAASAAAGGSLAYGNVVSPPVVASTSSIQTPNNPEIVSEITFAFDSFEIEGSNLPTDGTISVKYEFLEDGGSTISTKSFDKDYTGSSINYRTESRKLKASSSSISLDLKHKLRITIEVRNSDSTVSFGQSKESGTFNFSTTIIDDFEDNDISEYSGGTGAFTTQSNTVKEGTYALEYTSTSRYAMSSTSGLESYPSRGDDFTLWIRTTGDVSNANITHWAVPSEASLSSISGYALSFDPNNGKIELLRYDSGSGTSLASTSVTLSLDVWYMEKIEWGTDDKLVCTIIDTNGNELASVSATDSDYASNTGVGFQANTGSGGAVFWDRWRTV